MRLKPRDWTRRKVRAVVLAWGWGAFGVGMGWAAQAPLVRSLQPPCLRAGWLEAQPRCCSTAVSGRREGQVRAAASRRAGSRGLRLAGGLGWGCKRDIISEQGSTRWIGGGEEGGMEGEGRSSRSVEQGCSWGA